MLTVRFCVPCIDDPGSTTVRVGTETTTLKPAVSTSWPPPTRLVVRVRSLTEAVAVGLMVILAVAVFGVITWKQFTVTAALKPVRVVPDCEQAAPGPGSQLV